MPSSTVSSSDKSPSLTGRTRGKCQLHGQHQPQSYTHVEHHIVPREWQKRWWPEKDKGIWNLGKLWAEDTITMCPTGHANVHFHIRRLLNDLRYFHVRMNIDVMEVVRMYKPRGANQNELKVAKQAIINWQVAGAPMEEIL